MDSMSADEKREAAKAGLAVGPKFEDMIDEAGFHLMVDRPALRTEAAGVGGPIPTQFQAWVGTSGAVEPTAAYAAPTEESKESLQKA